MSNEEIEPDEMNGMSKDVWEEMMGELMEIFPGVLSEDEVDCDQLRKLVGEDRVAKGERYQFSWAGKTDAIQEIKKRTTATLRPDKEESVNFKDTENLFIEGENLEVLRTLQKAYYGRVKMIFIDPPYNTGNDFVYNDSFGESVEEYEEKTGDRDENGERIRALQKNTNENGQYHSRWLSMMYPRLFLAKNLLKDDGIIFVSIDDNEVHNLKMVMNEIFGEENFIASVIWENSVQPKGYKGKFSVHHNYILAYQKSDYFELGTRERTEEDNKHYSNPDDDPKGPWRRGDVRNALDRPNLKYEIETPSGNVIEPPKNGWRWSKETMEEKMEKGEIIFNDDETGIIRKIYLEDVGGRPPESIWHADKVGDNREATKELKELFEGESPYDTPKPTELIMQMLEITTEPEDEDIVLDFFAGSCTTAHSVIKQNLKDDGNRKFIMVQIPEKVDDSLPAGINALEHGLNDIAEVGRERIRRASEKIKEDNPEIDEGRCDFGFKSFRLSDSNFKSWVKQEYENEEALQQKLEEMVDNIKEEVAEENMLYELMLKLGLDPNTDIEQKKGYYSIGDNEYLICLENEVTSNLVKEFLNESPRVVVCLDEAFQGNDELKTNTALQMKSEEIEFKVV